MIGNVSLGFLGEVGYFNLSLLLDLHEVFFDFLDLGLVLSNLFFQFFLLQILLVLDPLYFHVQVLLLLQQFPQLVLVLKFVGDERVELLRSVVLHKLHCVTGHLLSSSNLVMRDRRSRVTLKESLSRSGLSLNSLHSFFVLSFRMIDKLAISTSISSSSNCGEIYLFSE